MKSLLFEPVPSPYLVPFDSTFRVADAATKPPKEHRDKDVNRKLLGQAVRRIRRRQDKLYADDRFALLLVFQALDAAGKDGTIRAVMTGINPAGCQVFSFKKPSHEELDHDFLWRVYRCLPERGRIGIFNRSHYEEVLVVRVHPKYLDNQRLPHRPEPEVLWRERMQSIRGFERHLARNGTVVLKFWLNVSQDEQRRRFLKRIDEPQSNWKFSPADIHERGHWNDYMEAYEHALNGTSRFWAPWYAIPADDKSYMRRVVADIVARTLKRLDLRYPEVPAEEREAMLAWREELVREDVDE